MLAHSQHRRSVIKSIQASLRQFLEATNDCRNTISASRRTLREAREAIARADAVLARGLSNNRKEEASKRIIGNPAEL